MNEASPRPAGEIPVDLETVQRRTGHLFDSGIVDQEFPDFSDLVSRLRFVPQEGRIWLDTHRVMLINVSTLRSLRRELVDMMGMAKARGLLTRMGYSAGSRDAALARKLRPQSKSAEAFLVGPLLRALKGGAVLEPVHVDIDVASGRFLGEFITVDSFEVDAHAPTSGLAKDPLCWMTTGYASGYTSTFMGRSILFREVECRGMGAKHCRMIGKPMEAWEDAEEDIRALQPEEFVNRFDAHGTRQRQHKQEEQAPARPLADFNDRIVGASPGFVAACRMLQKVAVTPARVIFFGETGVGKEMFARTLHRISRRADKPFIAVNCAAIPDNLIESELFGVQRGAYTGAQESRPGRFERANGGTLFLDEVGTLTPTAQVKLLRAIQQGEIERVGDTKTRKVDVRLIAATNIDLEEAVRAGTFRNDLLYRLNVFPIHIPPLRERRDDIPMLMDHFLGKYTTIYEKRVSGFTTRAVDALYEYDYPGNIRELENLIERGVILAEEDEPIDLCHLSASDMLATSSMMRLDAKGTLHAVDQEEEAPATDPLAGVMSKIADGALTMETLEDQLINEAVDRCGGNISAAARMLNMNRHQLDYRLRKKRQDGD
jgi:DNA-binding NtrC family response regulator